MWSRGGQLEAHRITCFVGDSCARQLYGPAWVGSSAGSGHAAEVLAPVLGSSCAGLSLIGCMSEAQLGRQLHGIGSSTGRAVWQGDGPLAPCTIAELSLTWSLLLVQQCR